MKGHEEKLDRVANYLGAYVDSTETKVLATFPLDVFSEDYDATERLLDGLPDDLTEE